MTPLLSTTSIHWILRVGAFLEFVGHGAFGIKTKAAWVRYFGVFGISEPSAWKLMPMVGAIDICLGILTLISPRRAALAYMAAWGLFTALLRPASGEGWWEFIERTYNFGVPFALLALHGFGRNLNEWFEPLSCNTRQIQLPPESAKRMDFGFRAMIALYLVGHGALGAVMQKRHLVDHYRSIGITGFVSDPQMFSAAVGWSEMVLAVLVLIWPLAPVLIAVAAWKVGTEFLFPWSGAYGGVWEFIERGSSYVAPLALVGIRAHLKKPSLLSVLRNRLASTIS